MRKFLLGYLLPRFVQYFLVIFFGVTLTFIIPRFSPSDPIDRQVQLIMTSGSAVNPEAIKHLREALTEMYGLKGSNFDQYLAFWGRLFRGDMGPSLSSFPTPVSELIGQAMPWTLGLLLTSVLISWIIGNILGAISSYYPKSFVMRIIDVLSQGVRPIPFYVMSMVLLILFAYTIPVFPSSGAYPMGTRPSFTFDFIVTLLKHSLLPAS